MKKLALLLAAAMAFTGLIGVSGAADAASTAAYPGSVGTKIASVSGLPPRVKHNKPFNVTVLVTAKVGNARPARGAVRIWIIRGGVIRQVRYAKVYSGIAHFSIRLPHKGKFKFLIDYLPARFGVWQWATATRYTTSF